MIPTINEAAFQLFVYPGRGFRTDIHLPLTKQQERVYLFRKSKIQVNSIAEVMGITADCVRTHIASIRTKGWRDV